MYKGVNGGWLKFLSPSDLKKIHLATMRVLGTVGIVVKEETALEILEQAGCKVNFKEERAIIPQYVVEEAIRQAPKVITLYGQKPEYDLVLEDTRVYCGTGGMNMYVLDLETGEKRKSVAQDIADFAKLVNSLDNVGFYMIPFYPHDVPPDQVDEVRYEQAFAHANKHITGGCLTIEGTQKVLKMAADRAGGYDQLALRPNISLVADTVSPFVLSKINTQSMMECARRGVPVIVGSEALAGGTGPATLAGNLVQINAEVLAALTVHQITNPGAPFIYGTIASIMDLRRGIYTCGALETGLISAGVAQMGQYYGIPVYATAGMSDAKSADCQAGFEKALSLLTTALSGANYIHDAVGMLEFAMTMSFEQAVIDNEIIGMVYRILQGIRVDDETLAVELMQSVGPQGHYLDKDHTLRHMKSEHFFPEIADRLSREDWLLEGGKDTRQRALEKARQILGR